MVELGCKFTNPVIVPDDDEGVAVVFTGTVKDVTDSLATIQLDARCGDVKVLGLPKAVVRV